ncbi:MAG: prephenate dehydrogenase/arogenate dehydrogenase family protein [Candidatus Diapherotrites archaeon]
MKSNNKTVIGIIGGTGKMGKWFRKFFEKNGCGVLICGKKTKLRHRELIEKSDIIIFSVPIGITVDLIKKYAKFAKKGQAITDFTSIKEAPLNAMLKHAPKDVEVFGMHPVFGPSVLNIKDQAVVLCPGRGRKWFNWMKKLMQKKRAHVKVVSASKHDEMMAIIQGSTHFWTISFENALKKLDFDFNEMIAFASPIYKARMLLLGRIMVQDPELYAEILIQNKDTLKVVRQLRKSANDLEAIIKRKDKKAFVKYFKESAYFGDYTKKLGKQSDNLLNKLNDFG